MSSPETCLLVIEDEADQISILTQMLSRESPGINISSTENQRSTMTYLADAEALLVLKPRVILLDLGLPDKEEGFELLGRLKSFYEAFAQPAVPILVLTHSTLIKDIARAYQLGADAYIVKPVINLGWVEFNRFLQSY